MNPVTVAADTLEQARRAWRSELAETWSEWRDDTAARFRRSHTDPLDTELDRFVRVMHDVAAELTAAEREL